MRLLDREKKSQITASWGGWGFNPAINIAALGVLAVICLFFSLAGYAKASGPPFGVESFSSALAGPTEPAGASLAQAGSHPDSFTTTIVLNHEVQQEGDGKAPSDEPPDERVPLKASVGGFLDDVEAALPRGFVIDPQATPERCSESELSGAGCPESSAVGTLVIGNANGFIPRLDLALYNMVPPPGVPGEFGTNAVGLGYLVYIVGHVRSDGDYGLTGVVDSVSKVVTTYSATVTLWGDPSAPSHDAQRGQCMRATPPTQAAERIEYEQELEKEGKIGRIGEYSFYCPVAPSEVSTTAQREASEDAFLTMPSACASEPLTSSVSLDSWAEAAGKEPVVPHTGLAQFSPAVTGCEGLRFEPKIEAQPSTTEADSASGLRFDLHVPQEQKLGGLATSDLNNAVVTFPAGLSPNPSLADGLEGCTPSQIGLQAPANERQAIVLPLPGAHMFTVSLGAGGNTRELPYDASASEVQQALEALPAIGAHNVEVSPATGGWEVTYIGALAGREGPRLHGEVSTDATRSVTLNATGGEFELELGGEHTASLPYNATAAMVQRALEPLSGLEGNVTVTGGPPFTGIYSPSYTYDVTFDGSLADHEAGALSVASSSLTTTASAFATLAAGSDVVKIGYDTATGAFAVGQTVTGNGIRSGTTIAAVEERALTLSQEPETPGTFVALTAVDAGTVQVSGRAVGSEPLAVSTTQAGGALLFHEQVANPENHGLLEDTACPNGSKIGNVLVKTPLLENPLPGSLYLARPFENVPAFGSSAHPGGSLLALYLVVEDLERGIVAKLAGHVEVGGEEDVNTALPKLEPGQIRASFDENPQLPVEDVKLETASTANKNEGLFSGPRAPLTTPATCGTYTTESLLEPWSHQPAPGEAAGTPDGAPSSSFEVTQAPGGGACASTPAQEPNAPAFSVGTLSPLAGSYSPVAIHVAREDGSQRILSVSGTAPPGLLGKLAGIEKCPQSDIEAAENRSHEGEGRSEEQSPSCPSSSEIATLNVGVGSGASLYVKAKAYLAGPWNGTGPCTPGGPAAATPPSGCAPFSGVFITPAVAGPFDLGVVVVRIGLYINPETAQVTLAGDRLPTVVHGFPVDIRSITGVINRPDFTLNPTNCEEMHVTGAATGEGGGVASLSYPFQAQGCTSLPFKPALTASAGAHGSKVGGTSLNIKVTSAGVGQADIQKLHLQFPKELSSRLTTLQKACTEKVFNANPASCDPDSMIGHAIVHTPLLSSPLIGPAILVSHGGAAFPDVEFVLQGEGVEVVVDAKTSIKGGITYSYIESAPDAPFTSFETEFPSGLDSVFTPNVSEKEKYSLCAQALTMPIEMTGQNGAELRQNIRIAPTGCSNSLRLVSKKLGPAGKTLTLSVEVPAAGKLTVSGRGLKRTSKTATARQILSLSISLANTDAAKIARHKSVKVKVNLAFVPSSGKKQTTSIAATYKAKAKGGGKK
jgi:hypothetical protein